MAWAARLVWLRMLPMISWASASFGLSERTLVIVASADASRAARSSDRKAAPTSKSARPTPSSASTLPGSSARARSKKPRA